VPPEPVVGREPGGDGPVLFEIIWVHGTGDYRRVPPS
jgi:hypothetical protein